jgi:integrase
MKLKKRGKTYILDGYINGQRIRISTGCQDLGEAKAVAPGLWAQAMTESIEKSGTGLTLANAFQRLMDEEWSKQRDVHHTQARIDEITEILGPKTRLVDIDRAALVRLQEELRKKTGRNVNKPASPATVNRKMAVIQRLLRVACEEWEELSSVPKVRPLKTPKTKMRGITTAEMRTLMKLVPADAAQVFKFLIETGLRVGEWDQLSWSAIDFEENVIRLDPTQMDIKTHSERTLPMTQSTRDMLLERRSRGLTAPFSDVGRDYIWYHFKKARKAMGLEGDRGFVLHALRHTTATRLIDKGVPTSTVQKWLGHSSITTTERYIQQSDKELHKYAKLVEV